MEALDDSAVKAVAALAREAQVPISVDGVVAVVIPDGSKVEWLDKYQPDKPPKRKDATPVVYDAGSFIGYYHSFHDEGSQIFADPNEYKVVGVLDYHMVGSDTPARHRMHRVTYVMQQTPEWKTWLDSDGKRRSQLEFAEFIENNSADIFMPAAADMIGFTRDLEATKDVTFGSSVRLDNGQVRFQYSEELKATVGKGKVEAPEFFRLRLRAFVGAAPVEVVARLRFRLTEGKLTMWYDLMRPHDVKELGFQSIVGEIAEKTGTPVLIGKP